MWGGGGRGAEQEFWYCFANRLNQNLVSSMTQAMYIVTFSKKTSPIISHGLQVANSIGLPVPTYVVRHQCRMLFTIHVKFVERDKTLLT